MINIAIQNRRSVRKYSDKPVTDEVLNEILMAAQFAPSAINKRAWEFMVIRDQALKETLYKLSGGLYKQDSIKKAPVVLIPLINTKKSVLPIQDISLAIENIFIQVAYMGLGAFWKNIGAKEAEAIKEAFDIPDNFSLINIIPLGYPADEVKPHTEKEYEPSRIHWEKW